MTFQIGTDEAGYGPNLGPLTVTGTLWKTPTGPNDLYDLLSSGISATAPKPPKSRLWIADSKTVYGTATGLKRLETNVLAMIHAWLGSVPPNWAQLFNDLSDSQAEQTARQQPWIEDADLNLPVAADESEILSLSKLFSQTCQAASVELQQIRCVPVFPPQFNDQIEAYGNKATLLSTQTLNIVRHLLDEIHNGTPSPVTENIEIGCDKHGGRSKYGALLQEHVTQEFVSVNRESLAISDYRFQEQGRRVSIRFEAKGESFLPTALASMVSKYVREISMILWNNFWQQKIPDLKPTKGYPQDAKRFIAAIEKVQRQLGMTNRAIWRNK